MLNFIEEKKGNFNKEWSWLRTKEDEPLIFYTSTDSFF